MPLILKTAPESNTYCGLIKDISNQTQCTQYIYNYQGGQDSSSHAIAEKHFNVWWGIITPCHVPSPKKRVLAIGVVIGHRTASSKKSNDLF
jgi:hypothetical protein